MTRVKCRKAESNALNAGGTAGIRLLVPKNMTYSQHSSGLFLYKKVPVNIDLTINIKKNAAKEFENKFQQLKSNY